MFNTAKHQHTEQTIKFKSYNKHYANPKIPLSVGLYFVQPNWSVNPKLATNIPFVSNLIFKQIPIKRAKISLKRDHTTCTHCNHVQYSIAHPQNSWVSPIMGCWKYTDLKVYSEILFSVMTAKMELNIKKTTRYLSIYEYQYCNFGSPYLGQDINETD